MASKVPNHILLTGVPNIGKTTIIKKVCETLKNRNVEITGFYTTEIRNTLNSRIGFDVVTLNGTSGKLARNRNLTDVSSKYTLGNYFVFINEFESLVLPLLKKQENIIFIIDEIGKMELFSRAFEKAITDLFSAKNIKIIATVPVAKIPIIEKLKNMPNSFTITVDYSNRNKVSDEILQILNIN